MIKQCPTCQRELIINENSVLVICKCGEVVFDKENEDGN